MYGFKNSVLHNISLTSFRMDGKTRFWITICRDGIYYEYMYKTWKELYASLEGILIGIHISEGSGIRRRSLIKELVEQGVLVDDAHEMINKKIAIIGGGNLGGAIACGLLKSELVTASSIFMTRRRVNLLEKYLELGIHVGSDNREAVKAADIVLIAVKPYQIMPVIEEIKEVLTKARIRF